jgi:hypothetical protein
MSAMANMGSSQIADIPEVQLGGIFKEKNIKFEDIAAELLKLPMKKRTSVHQFKRCI